MIKKDDLRTVHLKFSDMEIDEIDDWRKKNMIRTRSEAIRQLIKRAMDSDFARSMGAGMVANEAVGGMAERSAAFMAPTPEGSLRSDTELQKMIREIVNSEVQKALINMVDND